MTGMDRCRNIHTFSSGEGESKRCLRIPGEKRGKGWEMNREKDIMQMSVRFWLAG